MSKWALFDPLHSGFRYIQKGDQIFVATRSAPARLEEIVSILNAHDDLVATLEAIAKQPPHTLACREMAQAALQKAGPRP